MTTEAIALNIIRTDKAKRRMLERAAEIVADSFPDYSITITAEAPNGERTTAIRCSLRPTSTKGERK